MLLNILDLIKISNDKGEVDNEKFTSLLLKNFGEILNDVMEKKNNIDTSFKVNPIGDEIESDIVKFHMDYLMESLTKINEAYIFSIVSPHAALSELACLMAGYVHKAESVSKVIDGMLNKRIED